MSYDCFIIILAITMLYKLVASWANIAKECILIDYALWTYYVYPPGLSCT